MLMHMWVMPETLFSILLQPPWSPWPQSVVGDWAIHLTEPSPPWPRIEKVDSVGEKHAIMACVDICLMIEGKLRMSAENVTVNGPGTGRTHVLKDVWIDEWRTTEGTRLRSIHQEASPEEVHFFLEVDCDGVVPARRMGVMQGEEDKTLNCPSSAIANSQTLLLRYAPSTPMPPSSASPSFG
jgi:hypothetical protein